MTRSMWTCLKGYRGCAESSDFEQSIMGGAQHTWMGAGTLGPHGTCRGLVNYISLHICILDFGCRVVPSLQLLRGSDAPRCGTQVPASERARRVSRLITMTTPARKRLMRDFKRKKSAARRHLTRSDKAQGMHVPCHIKTHVAARHAGLQQDPPEGVNASPRSDNIMSWRAVIFGPEGTVWDGGTESGAPALGCVLILLAGHAMPLLHTSLRRH